MNLFPGTTGHAFLELETESCDLEALNSTVNASYNMWMENEKQYGAEMLKELKIYLQVDCETS